MDDYSLKPHSHYGSLPRVNVRCRDFSVINESTHIYVRRLQRRAYKTQKSSRTRHPDLYQISKFDIQINENSMLTSLVGTAGESSP